ncbi:MAG: diacylglycerol/lipid kinase family protein [Bacilli bacterium]
MKHIFVINPKAGKNNKVNEISEVLKSYNSLDYEIYVTKSKGDAQGFVRNYLLNNDKKEIYRFYACGGDGTLHDVVKGAYGFENVEVACIACGSGNDFVKNYQDRVESFSDIKKVIDGKSEIIDLIKVNDKVSINILNCGFDGEVTFTMHKLKKIPFIKGALAYNLAAITSLLFKMSSYMKLIVDDEVLFEGKSLLAVIANGFCYGGGFYCAPEANVNDGLIDICFFKKISRFKAAGLMKVYKKGKHLDSEKIEPYLIYRKCKKVIIECLKPIAYAIDGEIFRDKRFECEIIPQCLKFVVPTL